MKIQCPPGMRDFYPEDMRLQNWLFEQWKQVSRSFGFSEYEGPIFEFLELYTLKSGEGIVSELFNFHDRGERHFAIRPEMTPTLARMVAARANALPRPIKWFSIPRMCRAEKPQRGRLREFFQWNADILGSEDVLADAEVIAVVVEFFRRVGVSAGEVAVLINSRPIIAAVLAHLGVPPDGVEQAFQLIDRHEKLGPEEFERQWLTRFAAAGSGLAVLDRLKQLSPEEAGQIAAGRVPDDARAAFTGLWERLRQFGVGGYCRFDATVARGLAYYTGVVFEAYGQAGATDVGRALLGGGRYDNLCELLDGPRVTGVGFGMGDAPVLEFLKDLGKLPVLGESVAAFVIDADEALFPTVVELASKLRQAGISAEFSYKRQNIGKQLKQASGRGARHAVIVGSEYRERGEVGVKDLQTGAQQALSVTALLEAASTGSWIERGLGG